MTTTPRATRPVKSEQESPETAKLIRDYIDYRYAKLEHDRREIQLRQVTGLGMGSLIRHDQDAGVIRIFLDELKAMADWFDAGQKSYVPPLSEDEKVQWRFARDHGGIIPEHILVQLYP